MTAQFHATSSGGFKAALVRSEINPASSSATLAMAVSTKRPIAPFSSEKIAKQNFGASVDQLQEERHIAAEAI